MAIFATHGVSPEIILEEVTPRDVRSKIQILFNCHVIIEAEAAVQRVQIKQGSHQGTQKAYRAEAEGLLCGSHSAWAGLHKGRVSECIASDVVSRASPRPWMGAGM